MQFRLMSLVCAFVTGLSTGSASAAFAIEYSMAFALTTNPTGSCSWLAEGVPCGVTYDNINNPLPGVSYHDYASRRIVAEARDGTVTAHADAMAEFAVATGVALLRSYVSSSGRASTLWCPANGQCMSANAAAFPTVLNVRVVDTVFAHVPVQYNGFGVDIVLTLPVDA